MRITLVSLGGCRRAMVGTLLAVLGVSEVTTEPRQSGTSRSNEGADVIVSWNGLAHDLAVAEDQFLTFKGQRALAMMHLAMHDALNAIAPIYETYAYSGATRLAHPIAATSQAAHDVLIAQYPDQRTRISDEHARWLANATNSSLRDRGIELGHVVAAGLLAHRDGDGWDFGGTYEFQDGPGRYQTTPPWNGFVTQPGFRFAKPFALEYAAQFRPSPPPPLRTTSYARAFREVKEFGAAGSTRRTDDQTAYAVWWMEFAEGFVRRHRFLNTSRLTPPRAPRPSPCCRRRSVNACRSRWKQPPLHPGCRRARTRTSVQRLRSARTHGSALVGISVTRRTPDSSLVGESRATRWPTPCGR
jgi:hypothetical protein